jgi:hypothetical protein
VGCGLHNPTRCPAAVLPGQVFQVPFVDQACLVHAPEPAQKSTLRLISRKWKPSLVMMIHGGENNLLFSAYLDFPVSHFSTNTS